MKNKPEYLSVFAFAKKHGIPYRTVLDRVRTGKWYKTKTVEVVTQQVLILDDKED